MASKIKEVNRVKTARVVNGTQFEKGDHINWDTSYVVKTKDRRQCSVSRDGVISMLAEIGISVAIRITTQMLSKLSGHTLNESLVEEEGSRLFGKKMIIKYLDSVER